MGCPIRIPPAQSYFDSSPRIFAANRVLHRLVVPRYSLCAAITWSNFPIPAWQRQAKNLCSSWIFLAFYYQGEIYSPDASTSSTIGIPTYIKIIMSSGLHSLNYQSPLLSQTKNAHQVRSTKFFLMQLFYLFCYVNLLPIKWIYIIQIRWWFCQALFLSDKI